MNHYTLIIWLISKLWPTTKKIKKVNKVKDYYSFQFTCTECTKGDYFEGCC